MRHFQIRFEVSEFAWPQPKLRDELPRMAPDPEQIRSMFASIASNYDKANDVLSVGIHHQWRKRVVAWSGAQWGDRVLDCATGTGDLAIEFKTQVGPTGVVVGTDFCQEMLDFAPEKAKVAGLDIKFEVADVTALPFDDSSFDIASIAFGIRNVGNPQKALSELHRVVKPGGRVMVLEFGQPKIAFLKQLYKVYSENILPRIGGWVTGKKDAYTYLEKSSAAFPCREEFLGLMKKSANFENLEFESLSLGIAYIYRASRARIERGT